MKSTEEQIEFFNQSLSIIKERCHKVFGLDISIDPVTLTPPDRYDSWMRAYDERASRELSDKISALFSILYSQHIIKPSGYASMSSSNTPGALTALESVVTKLQKY